MYGEWLVFTPDSAIAYVSQIAGDRILAIDTAARAIVGVHSRQWTDRHDGMVLIPRAN